jgi:hypothetical protein
LSQDDKNAKKGSITQFQGKVMNLWMLQWMINYHFIAKFILI